MNSEQIVVLDWTRSAARVGVFAESVRGWHLQSESNLPPRLVLIQEQGESPHVLAAEAAATVRADQNTLIFEEPARQLPSLEDPELQSLLLAGFWRALEQSLVTGGQLHADRKAAGYAILPHRFSQSLLENFRTSCGGERPLKFCGSVHEAAAFVIGFLRSEAFQLDEDAMPDDAPVTICFVLAADEQTIDVVCFDYTRANRALHRVVIRDFFQTTCSDLSTRLHECDWLGVFSLLVIVEDPALSASAQAAINVPLQAIAAGNTPQRHQLSNTSQFKLRGAAHIALCAAGRATDEAEYDVAHACHVGVQINQQHFQPVINKDEWAQLTEFPHLAAQAFRLTGEPGNALRLNFYSGYSTTVVDAVPLGHTMLWQEDLAQLGGAALTAAVRLDAPTSGEVLLGLMPENRELRRQPFTLPGLME
jgi:hypothetical protein